MITIGGMDLNDFINHAIANAGNNVTTTTTTYVNGRPVRSGGSYVEEIPTQEYGDETVDRVHSSTKKLIFDGTKVGSATTQTSIEFKNGASVLQAKANLKIEATDCPNLGRLNANGAISLFNSSVSFANAGGKIVATNCENAGHLNAGGKVELFNCSNASANAGGKVIAKQCKNLELLSAGGKVFVQDSTVDSVSAGSSVSIENSTITNCLEYSGTSTVRNSNISNIRVLPSGMNNVTIVNGYVINPSRSSRKVETLYLENTTVGDIFFEGEGRVVLRGSSKVTGEITNGKII